MRLILVSGILISLLTLTGAANELELPHIIVNGTATTDVVPNQMKWRIEVKNTDAQVEVVADKHTRAVASVLRFLKETGVPDDNIQTTRMEFGENRVYKNSARVKQGYIATTDVLFDIKDLDKYKDLWIGLAGISGVSVKSVTYDHTDRIKIRNETRKKALLNAKEKARGLAGTLGSQIGDPLVIQESPSVGRGGRPEYAANLRMQMDSSGGGGPVLALGKIPIQTTVMVVFQLITTDP